MTQIDECDPAGSMDWMHDERTPDRGPAIDLIMIHAGATRGSYVEDPITGMLPPLDDAELALCKHIYRLVGFRECGVIFDADEVPSAHMVDLCKHFIQWQPFWAPTDGKSSEQAKVLLARLEVSMGVGA